MFPGDSKENVVTSTACRSNSVYDACLDTADLRREPRHHPRPRHYDPLPFTQGTITGFDHAVLQIAVKVDPGYPDDAKFLATISDGFCQKRAPTSSSLLAQSALACSGSRA
jgi:hypothetical protein